MDGAASKNVARGWARTGEEGSTRGTRARSPRRPRRRRRSCIREDGPSVERASPRGVLFQFQRVNWNCLPQTPRAACLSTVPHPRHVSVRPSACSSSNSHRRVAFVRLSGVFTGINSLPRLRDLNFWPPFGTRR